MLSFRFFSSAILTLYCLVFSLKSSAQTEAPEFGQVSTTELALKECSFDKSADAMILLDKAVAYFNEEYNLITEHRIRIKILKEKGIDRANIRIPYYSADNFESIQGVEGVAITPGTNGDYTTNVLENKNIFSRKINRLYSIVSFALPNVKVGSIIDYKYRSTMKNYAGLRSWEFQSEIPVVTSDYELAPLANSEFAYTVHKSEELPIQIMPDKANGRIRFVMQNIPGLRDEVYTASTRSFLQRVNFQFASYTNYIGKKDYSNTWQKLAAELLDEPAFGSQINKDLSGTNFLKSLSSSLSPTEKVKAIYEFVRSNISWDNITSKYSEDGVKSILEKRKGNSGDINLLLVSLLKSAGLEAYPVIVSERDNGIVDTTYSYLEQFNKVLALVVANGNQYVLDGTDVNTPFFMVPPDELNTIGFLVDKKKFRFVYFNNLPLRQREMVNLVATVATDGTLQGEAMVKNFEYAKLEKESQFRNDKSRYQEALTKAYSFLKVDSFSVDGLKNDSAELSQLLRFHYNLKKSGGYYLLNANLFTDFNENPFITQYRFTDIDFGTKYNGVVSASFNLPSGLAMETLPANKRLVSPDRSMSVTRMMEKGENFLTVKYQVDINREKYAADEYENVKAFFKQMTDLLNEPVLLKAN